MTSRAALRRASAEACSAGISTVGPEVFLKSCCRCSMLVSQERVVRSIIHNALFRSHVHALNDCPSFSPPGPCETLNREVACSKVNFSIWMSAVRDITIVFHHDAK